MPYFLKIDGIAVDSTDAKHKARSATGAAGASTVAGFDLTRNQTL